MKMIKELSQAPIILGRPFLATTKAVTDWEKGEVIFKVGEHTVKVDINKLMKYPSRASKDLGAIDFADNQDIDAYVEEVMIIDEEARYEELSMDEPTLELKTLPSTLKYAFLDEEKAKPVIISSKLDIKQEKIYPVYNLFINENLFLINIRSNSESHSDFQIICCSDFGLAQIVVPFILSM